MCLCVPLFTNLDISTTGSCRRYLGVPRSSAVAQLFEKEEGDPRKKKNKEEEGKPIHFTMFQDFLLATSYYSIYLTLWTNTRLSLLHPVASSDLRLQTWTLNNTETAQEPVFSMTDQFVKLDSYKVWTILWTAQVLINSHSSIAIAIVCVQNKQSRLQWTIIDHFHT